MNVLFYAKAREEGLKFLQVVEESFPEGSVEIFRTVDRLAQRLRQPSDDALVAVLLASGKDDLENIYAMQSLLENVRLILVLPGRNKEMIAKAHSLRPRYLAFKGGDFSDVAAVLSTMAKKAKRVRNSSAKVRAAGQGVGWIRGDSKKMTAFNEAVKLK